MQLMDCSEDKLFLIGPTNFSLVVRERHQKDQSLMGFSPVFFQALFTLRLVPKYSSKNVLASLRESFNLLGHMVVKCGGLILNGLLVFIYGWTNNGRWGGRRKRKTRRVWANYSREIPFKTLVHPSCEGNGRKWTCHLLSFPQGDTPGMRMFVCIREEKMEESLSGLNSGISRPWEGDYAIELWSVSEIQEATEK